MKVVGIYLAAGESQRMGTNKLALPVGKMSLGSLALDTALNSTLSKVFIIIRNEDDASWIALDMLNNPKAVIVKCPNGDLGQAESLRCGIEQAENEKADAAMVILADQPFITVMMLDEIIDCMKSNPTCNYVATTDNDLLMPPVLFSATLFPALLDIDGDTGARAVLRGIPRNMGRQIPCKDKRFVFDVDTSADYKELLS
ncbi:NTP transferase domain-containing protein [Sporosarcina sp. Marseille-Q4063]|uniref:nucleotidyltransferase family protein n=1 Tax=Sporosarcina sp. Marseille-Q4063 TaxID=2810514 RepID=UPI001BAEF920|nr:nucleotidyltransferase family protein [Sporosarcina sp. Marseille-Q4063]QUW22808.1 NTP transferase domain-containing protein [Sporosarcina sp. Marseille-Q4063]